MSSLLMLGAHRSYHLYRKETDMRKGFNQLCGIITNELGRQVTQGDAFIFINLTRTHLKLLVYEQGGFTISTADWSRAHLKFRPLTWMLKARSSPAINFTSSCRASLCKQSAIAKNINKSQLAVEKKIIGMADYWASLS